MNAKTCPGHTCKITQVPLKIARRYDIMEKTTILQGWQITALVAERCT